ncbi:uncharacterized protein EV154DRAFT_508914 [Mucor mucedo]|uniref:uncharacterized protein n=1 Tax=Mucor mucedo TaxID=29922 RepID=UPI002220CF9C|nr:uncharacterized protein EV154DRAFT_508914 [Mucor mucedo]KAI7891176.1 hypothetical protein EV154DRAFT_508914 [Mucor mucedo]
MHLNINHLTKNPIVLVSVVMAVVGWFIAFIGACILGASAGGFWWTVIFELLLVAGLLFSIFKKVFHQYKVMFLVFLAVSIAMLTGNIDGLMHQYTGGAQAAGAGAVILIVMQFFWVILFGSTEESAVYQFVYSGLASSVSHNSMNNMQSSAKESKVALSSPEANSHYSQHQPSIASIPAPHMTPPPTTPHQTFMATALHPC